MNHYESRLEDRRARLEAAADKRRQDAQAKSQQALSLANIMQGEPIKIGHHSEGRHRRDIARMDRAMGASVAADREADDLQYRASRVGTAGISSDDPDAIDKLREKLAALEARQAAMKAANAGYRKHGAAALAGLSPALQQKAESYFRFSPGGTNVPFPGYALTNNNGKIKRAKERIAALEAQAARPDVPTETACTGFAVREDPEDNRVWITFADRAPKAACDLLKLYGFRWSPTRTAWVRMLNQAGRNTAEILRPRLESIIAGSASD